MTACSPEKHNQGKCHLPQSSQNHTHYLLATPGDLIGILGQRCTALLHMFVVLLLPLVLYKTAVRPRLAL